MTLPLPAPVASALWKEWYPLEAYCGGQGPSHGLHLFILKLHFSQ